MKHLIAFYYILCFSTGLIGLVIIILIYSKTKIKIVLNFFIFYFLLSLLVVANTFYYYITSIVNYQNTAMHIFFSLIFFMIFGALAYEGPYITHQLAGNPFGTIKKIVFGIIACLSPILAAVPFISNTGQDRILNSLWFLLYNIYINLFFITYLYTIIYALLNYKNIKNRNTKKILRTSLLLLIIFLPAFLLDGYWEFFQEKLKLIPRYINFMPVFYLFWSIASIYFSAKYLFVPSVGDGSKFIDLSGITLSDTFIRQFGISARESEIICLVLQGMGNSEIGEKLFISTGTVKNHIHNIYEKTGVKNRYELANQIKKAH